MGYAKVLIDSIGNLSGYRCCDGEVCYMPQNRQPYETIFCKVAIDLDTMEAVQYGANRWLWKRSWAFIFRRQMQKLLLCCKMAIVKIKTVHFCVVRPLTWILSQNRNS